MLNSTLVQALQDEGFTGVSEIASLSPGELVAMADGTIDFTRANLVWQTATILSSHEKVPEREMMTAEARDVQDRSFHSATPALIQVTSEASSLRLTAAEKKMMLKPSKDRRRSLLDSIWFTFVLMGAGGLHWTTEINSDINAAKESFMMKFANGDTEQLAPIINCMRRWTSWHNDHIAHPGCFWCPGAVELHKWFTGIAPKGATVVHNMLGYMTWWRTHVGVPFPVHDVLLAGWHAAPTATAIKEQPPFVFASVLSTSRNGQWLTRRHRSILLIVTAHACNLHTIEALQLVERRQESRYLSYCHVYPRQAPIRRT